MRDSSFEESDRVWSLLPYMLGSWPEDVVSRSTLRSLLPAGTTRHGSASRNASRMMRGSTGNRNTTSEQFNKALSVFEKEGLVRRGQEFILVLDRRGLIDRAGRAPLRPSFSMARVDSAVSELALRLRDEDRGRAYEIRYRELQFLKQIMESTPASTSHRGTKSLWPVQDTTSVARIADRDATRTTDGMRHPVSVTKKGSS